ncbi:MAG: hypothetical protein RMK57_15150 [Bryobacterales bacterium]|nr:DUF4380 domain-containing protein [Bryobacteraceae bacterium]MDW8355858.1 hypothetical protein [Bryobacterales bacterium]
MCRVEVLVVVVSMVFALRVTGAVRIEKISYQGWPNCYRVSNGEVELVVTGDVGPRILRYAFVGERNFFKEYPEMMGKSGEKQWMIRGGHRLWRAPEDPKLTYALDNDPVKIDVRGSVLIATQPVEALTGIEKQIEVRLAARGTAVEVVHRMRNTLRRPQEFAAWALTVMAPGGVAVTGFPPRGRHPEVLLPTNPLVMWAYTDFSDPRWTFTKKYLILRQDPQAREPQKAGLFHPDTWGAYVLGTDLFLKRSKADPSQRYPDFGCSFETFTNQDMLELETLGPLTQVRAGGTVEHIERWSLHRNVRIGAWNDEQLDRVFVPLLGAH